jgi:hypothetical protein
MFEGAPVRMVQRLPATKYRISPIGILPSDAGDYEAHQAFCKLYFHPDSIMATNFRSVRTAGELSAARYMYTSVYGKAITDPNRCLLRATSVGAAIQCIGADVNATDIDGSTAFMKAAARKDRTMMSWLLRVGASLDKVDLFGHSWKQYWISGV